MSREIALSSLLGKSMTSAVLGPLDGANEQKNRIFFVLLPDSRSTHLQEIAVYEKSRWKMPNTGFNFTIDIRHKLFDLHEPVNFWWLRHILPGSTFKTFTIYQAASGGGVVTYLKTTSDYFPIQC